MRQEPIIEVRDGLVICGGKQLAAPLRGAADGTSGTHEMLRPVVHLAELQHDAAHPPKAGDHVEFRDDGSRVHVPKS